MLKREITKIKQYIKTAENAENYSNGGEVEDGIMMMMMVKHVNVAQTS